MRRIPAVLALCLFVVLASACTRTSEVQIEHARPGDSTPATEVQAPASEAQASETHSSEAVVVGAQVTPAPTPGPTVNSTAAPSQTTNTSQTIEPVAYHGPLEAPEGMDTFIISLGRAEAAGGAVLPGGLLAAFATTDDGGAVGIELIGDLAVLERREPDDPYSVELVVAVAPDLVAPLEVAASRDALVLASFDQRRDRYWITLELDAEDLVEGAVAPGDFVSLHIDDGRAPSQPIDTIQVVQVSRDEQANRWLASFDVASSDLATFAEALVRRPVRVGPAAFTPVDGSTVHGIAPSADPAGLVDDGLAAYDLTLPAWHLLGGHLQPGEIVTVVTVDGQSVEPVGQAVGDAAVLRVATTVPAPQVHGSATVQLALSPEQAAAIEQSLVTGTAHLARRSQQGDTHELMFEMSSTRAARGQVRAGDLAHVIGPETDNPLVIYVPAAEVVALSDNGQTYWPVLTVPSQYLGEIAALMHDVEFGLFLTTS